LFLGIVDLLDLTMFIEELATLGSQNLVVNLVIHGVKL
jgi:hypothetical protein